MADVEKDRDEIRWILKNINEAWTKGRPADLDRYFHEDMVIAQPGFGIRGEGKSACVNSYREFSGTASIRSFEESQHVVLVWGDTAVASYKFEIEYDLDGLPHRDTGYDLFVLTRQGGDWLAVWRAILPAPEPA